MQKDSQIVKKGAKDKNWECKYPGCDKKYPLESSLYNHIRIKHPGVDIKQIRFNQFLKDRGRPKKKKNTDISEQEESMFQDTTNQELIIGFYKSKLWVKFALEFKDHIGKSISETKAEVISLYEEIKTYINQLDAYYQDISNTQTQQQHDDFIKQVDMFSMNLQNEDNGLRFNVCKAIVLFYLMNTSLEFQHQQDFFNQLQNIDQEILDKVCRVFCSINDSNYGQCKYQRFVQQNQEQLI
ncbi:hypothetical protein ABPG74_003629 [Tetrahymena malaccensis]